MLVPVHLRRTFLLTTLLAFGLLALVGRPAGAADDSDYTERPPTTVVGDPPSAGTPIRDDRATERSVRKVEAVASAQTVARSRLAITGTDVTQTVVLGAALLGVGTAVMVARRRMTPIAVRD